MDESTERWLPVVGFEGSYEVSSLARVRSLDRIVTSRNKWGPITLHLRGKILTQAIGAYGYPVVTLSRDGRSRPYRVHRLVGKAFFGQLPPGMDTRHGPNGRRANTVTDICYGTRAENEQDKIRDGTYRHGVHRGEMNKTSKLTTAAVIEIRRRYAVGQRQVDLAQAFGVTQAAISSIVRRKTWAHVS